MAVKSPLNAAVGDHLHASGNALAIPMSLRMRDGELVLQRAALKAALPDAGKRICVLIHGLGCSEATFFAAAPQRELGEELARELGYTPLYLRYNSGLAIERNGELLAAKLDKLLSAWPHADSELLLIGHSMGGLVARSACAQAAVDARWPLAVRMLISLGSPNTGAPLARHGRKLQQAIDSFAVSAPIGRLGGARSRGVQDLHDGLAADATQRWPHIALRFLGAHLGEHPEGTAATLFGDGLVPIHSSTTLDGLTPTESAVLSGVGHLQLPVDPRCWEQVREWIKSSREMGVGSRE
jgi:pimeloyl-ACP methyl ester carboxylesterase